jgi:hypothetical protein
MEKSLGLCICWKSVCWISFCGVMSMTKCMLLVCVWYLNVMRQHLWCDYLINPGYVGKNMERNWVLETWHYSCRQWVTCWSVLNWWLLHKFFELLCFTTQIAFI